MNIWKLVLVIAVIATVVAFIICPSISSGGLELVKDGRPNAVVVTAADANRLIKRAAEDFVYHVKLLTGAELPVVTNGAGAAEGNVVYIGASEGTRALGIDADSLPREGFRILARGKALAIVGKDKPVITYAPDGGIKRMDDDPFSLYAQPATWYGVAHFFEKYYGVRWFWPGEAGIYYEPRKTLAVEALDETRAPAYILRQMRSLMNGSGLSRFPKEVFRQVNYAPGDVDRMVAEYKVWERRVRLGRGGMIQASHSLGYFYDMYSKDHPEYFAQRIDGTREWPTIWRKESIKLCVSNPDVARILIENGEKFFEGRKLSNIEDFTYNIGFTDGDGWCCCAQCRALDPQDQEKRTYSEAIKTNGIWISKNDVEYVFLSDRYVMLWNKVAAALEQKHPGKFVGSLMYGACSAPPVRERVHPNVLLNTTAGSDFHGTNPVGKIARRVEGWFKAGLKNFYWRPNLMYFDHYGLPYTYAWEAGRAMQYLAKQGMKGFDFDTWRNHFGSDGVNIYVILRLAWDPELDTDTLIREYCDKAYGKAGREVYRYLEYCSRIRERMGDYYKFGSRGFAEIAHVAFDPRVLEDLGQIAAQIEVLSKNDEAQFRKRTEVFLQAFRYLEMQVKALAVLHAEGIEKEENGYARLCAAIDRREQFIENLGPSWAIFAPDLRANQTVLALIGAKYHGISRSTADNFTLEYFERREDFERRAQSFTNVQCVASWGNAKQESSWLQGKGAQDGSVVWNVKRAAPIAECKFSYYSQIPFENDRQLIFSVSVDNGQSWIEAHTRKPQTAESNQLWGGADTDITGLVKGKKSFLLKVVFKNGGGRLYNIKVHTALKQKEDK